jgi:5-methylcytosine-specific restriction endonuclease McrA
MTESSSIPAPIQEEIKPCPNCGSERILKRRMTKSAAGPRPYFFPICRRCISDEVKRRSKKNPRFYRKKRMDYYYKNHEANKKTRRERRAKNAESERARMKEYREKNKDRMRELERIRYKRRVLDPAFREKANEAGRRSYEKNKHKPAYKARLKAYLKTEHGKIVAANNNARRRARYRNSESKLKPKELKELMAKWTHCYYCGTELVKAVRPEVEHVHPISKGGHHSASNVAKACHACNYSKNDKMIGDWAAISGMHVFPLLEQHV